MVEVQELGSNSDDTHKKEHKDMTVQLLMVYPEILPQSWVWAKPLLEKVWDKYQQRLSLEDVYSMILHGRAHLWLANTKKEFFCAAVTEMTQYPLCVECHVSWLGGEDPKRFLTLLSSIEDWAYRNGATRIQVEGRPGWKRALAPLGYEEQHIIVGKALVPRRMN